MQAKLLTVLQNRKITRIGSNKVIPVDIRLLSATNKNIQDMVDSGTFREDFIVQTEYYSSGNPAFTRTEGRYTFVH